MNFPGTHLNNILYIHGRVHVNEITPRQWDFPATTTSAGAVKGRNIIFTIPIYSIIILKVRCINGDHGHISCCHWFLNDVCDNIVDKTSSRKRYTHITEDEARGRSTYVVAVSLVNHSGIPPPRRVSLIA